MQQSHPYSITGLKSDALHAMLYAAGFVCIRMDNEVLVMTDNNHKITLEALIESNNVKFLICNTKFIKKYVPLDLLKLQNFVVDQRQMSTKTYQLN